jgi:flagellar hook-associated protein 3 FlgL
MEMNVNFAGRYVFSGFRTNKPPILMEDSTNVYRIEQTFSAADAEDTFSYAKFPNLPPEIGNIKVLKLPYNNVSSLNAGPVVINTVASPQTPGAYSPNASEINYISETGELILGENVYNQLTSADILLEYTKDNIKVGEINPEVYFTCADVTDPLNIIYYNMDAHDMEYEFGIDARIPVNSLAKNVYRDKMFSDLKSFVELVSKVEISDRTSLENYLITQGLSGDALSDALEMQITKEEQSISGLLQDRFSDMLASLDNYAKIVGSERADLGSRMARLELIDSRLAESEVTYTGLLSDNEDADYMETIMRLRNAESVYQASLQMGAKIIQTSLAEFIR